MRRNYEHSREQMTTKVSEILNQYQEMEILDVRQTKTLGCARPTECYLIKKAVPLQAPI